MKKNYCFINISKKFGFLLLQVSLKPILKLVTLLKMNTFLTISFFQFAPYGDLWNRIERNGGLDEADLKTVVKQVASALEFMHSKGLVHRDVRAENVLVFSEDLSRIKLTDFGLTRRTDTLVKKRTRSLPTCPPEIWEAVHLEG